MTLADLQAQAREADDALAAAETTLEDIRREERKAAAAVNRAALIAGALHRALEAIEDEAPHAFHAAREGATTYT